LRGPRPGFCSVFKLSFFAGSAELDLALAGKIERASDFVAVHLGFVDDRHARAIRVHVHGERQIVVLHSAGDGCVAHLAGDHASKLIAILLDGHGDIEGPVRRIYGHVPGAGDIGGERGQRGQE
jgi:hypothetical protein